MKKNLVRALSLLLVGSFMVGCSTQGEPTTSTGAVETTSKEGTSKKEKTEEISVMIWDRGDAAPGTTIENNTLTKYIQEQVLEACNVKVNFVAIPRSGSDDKLNIMMAGGGAPDLIYTYTRSMVLDYATKGGLAELSDEIEAFGPNIKEYLEPVLDIGYINGGQYSIPQNKGQSTARHGAYIRKDWLDMLGREVPTTKAELIDVLYEFKEKDPGNVGADKVIPWAMGGNQDTEKYFTNFVFSYAEDWDDKSMTMYEGYSKAVKPGTKEGYKILNQLYNDRIITKDFAVDTNDDKYKQDIVNGYAGFFVDDATRPIQDGWLETLKENMPEAEFIPLNCFENKNNEYTNAGGALQGRYLMVPKTSEGKAGAVVKYLNWLADPVNSENVAYTPDHQKSSVGAPIKLSEEELTTKGYSKTTSDFSIINGITTYSIADAWKESYPAFSGEYIDNVFDVFNRDLYYEPVAKQVLKAETKYETNLKKAIVEFAYKVISAKATEFETVYETEYKKLNEAGLQQVVDERADYYDSEIAGK